MNRTVLGTSVLATVLAIGAYWSGASATSANAAPGGDRDIGGKVELLRLAVPAGDAVGDVLGATLRSAPVSRSSIDDRSQQLWSGKPNSTATHGTRSAHRR